MKKAILLLLLLVILVGCESSGKHPSSFDEQEKDFPGGGKYTVLTIEEKECIYVYTKDNKYREGYGYAGLTCNWGKERNSYGNAVIGAVVEWLLVILMGGCILALAGLLGWFLWWLYIEARKLSADG